jgi:hypothetical protein
MLLLLSCEVNQLCRFGQIGRQGLLNKNVFSSGQSSAHEAAMFPHRGQHRHEINSRVIKNRQLIGGERWSAEGQGAGFLVRPATCHNNVRQPALSQFLTLRQVCFQHITATHDSNLDR